MFSLLVPLQVLGSRKPNCVIIDEIDGATGGAEGHSAIAALVKIITAGSKQQQAGADLLEKGVCSMFGVPAVIITTATNLSSSSSSSSHSGLLLS